MREEHIEKDRSCGIHFTQDWLSCGNRWFANPKRFGWYIWIRVARAVATPVFNMAAVILVKHLIIGRFEPGPRDLSQWGLLRHWLMAKLMPGGNLGKVRTPSLTLPSTTNEIVHQFISTAVKLGVCNTDVEFVEFKIQRLGLIGLNSLPQRKLCDMDFGD